ncbi:MAG: hypothetical protein OEN23_18020 [Paracoccaceae bacterium]|nr:hypothetical protein [Paracoccaceae bacterium]
MPKAAVTREAIKRAVKGVCEAGLPVKRVEVTPDGKVIVISDEKDAQASGANDWDKP